MITKKTVIKVKAFLESFNEANIDQIMQYLSSNSLYPNNQNDQTALREQLNHIRTQGPETINLLNLARWDKILNSIANDYDSDVSEVESLLSDDETDLDEEAILGPSFNIPFGDKFIQGNKIHKELAGIENTFKELFYEQRGNFYQGSFDQEDKKIGNYIKNYKNRKEKIKIKEKALREQKKTISEMEFKIKLKEIEDLKNSNGSYNENTLKDAYPESGYPNFASAKISYIKKHDNNQLYIHTKTIRAQKLLGNSHPEGEIFKYAKAILQSTHPKTEKYKTAKKIIIDIHTKLDMCAAYENCIAEGNRLIGIDGYEDKIVIRTSYDVHHGWGHGSHNVFLYQSCQYQSTILSIPHAFIIQQPIEVIDCNKSALNNIDDVLISSMKSKSQHPYLHEVQETIESHDEFLFNNLLAPQQRHAVNVPGDGNCFFHAIARQLLLTANGQLVHNQIRGEVFATLNWIYEDIWQDYNARPYLHRPLLNRAIDYMEENPASFVNAYETAGIEGVKNFNDYIRYLRQNHDHRDNSLIDALQEVLETDPNSLLHFALRNIATNYMDANRIQFEQAFESGINSIGNYIFHMGQDREYADNYIIQALASAIRVNLNIREMNGVITNITPFTGIAAGATLDLAYTGHRYTGQHYLSIEPRPIQGANIVVTQVEGITTTLGDTSIHDHSLSSSSNLSTKVSKPNGNPTATPTSMPTVAPILIESEFANYTNDSYTHGEIRPIQNISEVEATLNNLFLGAMFSSDY